MGPGRQPSFLPGLPAPKLVAAVERVLARELNGKYDSRLVERVAIALERELALSYLLTVASHAARVLDEPHRAQAANLERAIERFLQRE